VQSTWNNSKSNLGTPHLFIDGAKMQRNVLKMADVARENGFALRPHVKTHKIPVIAREQLEAGAAGITVAKLSEAEVVVDDPRSEIKLQQPTKSPNAFPRGSRTSS
jgi:D-serine deaminase-like pyridoxal phosphate-dependent protein